MSKKLSISLVAVIVLAITAAFAVYFWDKTYEDQIAEGVRIGGVDVGGLGAEEATSQLRASLVDPLNKDVVVRYDDEKFKLDSKELDIRADIDRMVDEALEASHEDGILTRTWRNLSGGELDYEIEPKIAYSEKSVEEFVAGVAENIDQEPQDATVEPTPTQLEPVPAQTGVMVEDGKLIKDVEKALQDPVDRKVEAEVDKVKPEVTTSELASKYPTYLVVDRSSFQLKLYNDLELTKTYTVAIGASATTHRPASIRSRTSRSIRSGTCPTPSGQARSPARPCRPGPTTRSRSAGWASTTAPASTAPTTSPPWAPLPHMAASGWRFRM